MSEDRFEALADYLIRESGYTKARRDVLIYSLRILNNSVWGFVVITLVGMLLQIPKVVLSAALATAALRIFSGGAHASASSRCVVGGGIIFGTIGLGLIAFDYCQSYPSLWQQSILLLLGTTILYYYAPADTPNKPIASKLQQRVLRVASFVIFGSFWALLALRVLKPLYAWAVLLGLAWQLFSLTPVGYRIVHRLDKALQAITLMISKRLWWKRKGVDAKESERR